MPAGRRQQSNAMLYTVITFVGLFIVATTVAVIFYVKAEKLRMIAATSQSRLEEMASPAEQQRIGALVGAKVGRKSRLGTMLDYLDAVVYSIVGGLPEETSAEVKVDTAGRKIKEALGPLAQKYPDIQTADPNTAGLIQIVEKVTAKLDNTTNATVALAEQLEQLQKRFDDAVAIGLEKEQTLLAEKEKYQQQVNDIAQDYSELKALVQQTSEQQVQTLAAQLDEEKANNKTLRQQLLKTQAELKMTEDRMKSAQQKLQELVPPPDNEIAAYKPDGEIILIDEPAGLVHLNIGSDDHVYRGLTFSVYDKSAPIPKHGRGKAEIEVLSVGKKISTARIIPSEDFEKALNKLLAENIDITTVMLSLPKPQEQRARDFERFAEGSPDRLKILNNLATAYDERGNKRPIIPHPLFQPRRTRYDERRDKRPIILGDIVANLIWDSDKANVFVVVGGFDLDGDGNIDRYAGDKIKSLITEWDGRVDDTVTIDTDFLVLGRAPEVLRKPTFEEMEVDPMATRKYEQSLQKLGHYEEVLKLAKDLSIPIFNTERFLCFIGYKTQAGRS